MITGKGEEIKDIRINGKYVRCCQHCIDYGETSLIPDGCGYGCDIVSCVSCLHDKKEIHVINGNRCFNPESQTD